MCLIIVKRYEEVEKMNNGAINYRRFLDGDDQGMVEIIKDYQESLVMFLNGYVHNIYLAEEIAEDVFFLLVIKKPRYLPKYSFKTWLFTIGRNRAVNALRSQGKIVSLDAQVNEKLHKDEMDLEKAYIKKEDRIALHHAIQQLLPQYSEVLYLAYFEMFSVSEISKITKKSVKQVSNLLYRAKGALKILLEAEGFEYEGL